MTRHWGEWEEKVAPDKVPRLALGTPSGTWLSRDGGESWEPLPGGMLGKGYYVNQLFFDANDNKTLYAGMIGGAFRASFEE